MYRLAFLIAAGLTAAAALTVYAEPPADPGDDPPVLKKKGAPDIDAPAPPAPTDKDKDKDKDKKPDAPKPDADKGQPNPPLPDPDEVLKAVSKDMRTVEDRLAKTQLGDGTRQAEADALKGLDSLIDQIENPPPDPNDKKDDASAKPDSSRPPGSKSGPASRSPRPSSGRKKKDHTGSKGRPADSSSRPGSEAQPSGDDPGTQAGRQPKDSANSGNPSNQGDKRGNNDPQMAKNPNADLYKDAWGNLPETLRAEMNAYSNTKGFMPEYEALISKYYSTIAEQGRRKGD